MKKFTIMILVLVLALGLAACGGSKTDSSEEPAEEPAAEEQAAEEPAEVPTIEKNIDAVAEALGLKNKEETYYDMVGADDGAEFNGGAVEIYQYDPASDAYKDIEAGNGAIKAEACNSGFVLVVPEGTEPDKKLIKAFKALEF